MLGRLAWLLFGASIAGGLAGGCELFHSTDWPTVCDEDAGAPGCETASSSSSTGGHHASSSSGSSGGGGAAGGGGSGGAGGGPPKDGTTAARAGDSCEAIRAAGFATGSHAYWIDVDGTGNLPPFQVHCEMTPTDGWTLAAVVSSHDVVNSWTPAIWASPGTFGVPSASGFDADMKNLAYGYLVTDAMRLENETGGIKTVMATMATAKLVDVFGSSTLLEFTGTESGWTYALSNDTNFFAEIQNPPGTHGKNLSPRNACVLSMGYDSYVNAAMLVDDQVQGFGCVGGSGGGSGVCFNMSCGDVVRDASLKIFAR